MRDRHFLLSSFDKIVCSEFVWKASALFSLQQRRHDNRRHSFRCQFYFNISMSPFNFFAFGFLVILKAKNGQSSHSSFTDLLLCPVHAHNRNWSTHFMAINCFIMRMPLWTVLSVKFYQPLAISSEDIFHSLPLPSPDCHDVQCRL